LGDSPPNDLMQVTPGVVLSAVSAVVALPTAAYAWWGTDADSARPLAVANLAIFVWAGGNAFQVASESLGAKLFWVDVQYAAITVLPVALFGFAATYAGHRSWATPRILGILSLPMVGLALTAWFAPGLVRTEVSTATVDGVVRLERTFGTVFWLGWLYSTVLNVLYTGLLLRSVAAGSGLLRWQPAAILVGAVVPWGAQFAYLGGLSPVEPEAFFVVSGVAFVLAVSRFRLLDVVPTARKHVVERIDDPLVVVDAGDRVVDANAAARHLFDAPDTVVGLPPNALFDTHPDVAAWYRDDRPDRVLAVEAAGDTRHLDPRTIDVEGRATALLFHDVTSLERKNEALEGIATTISHDLRNPLTVAQGYVDLARAGDGEALDEVDEALDRMDAIVSDVLALARRDGALDREAVSLAEAARLAWGTVDTGDATLAVADDATLDADPSHLRSLLENCFRNAVEHGSPCNRTEAGGAVEHGSTSNRTETGDAGEQGDAGVTVTVGGLDDGGFYVADDGPGIPEADRDDVFEQGYTTSADGTGFGLAIVRRVADAHGWKISVGESEAGGARFEFRTGE
jgi:signal transduction histidine kinase